METFRPVVRGDVATKQDLDALRLEVAAEVTHGERRMIQRTVTTMIAITGVTTAFATAIARLA
jgi:hypothetical protein